MLVVAMLTLGGLYLCRGRGGGRNKLQQLGGARGSLKKQLLQPEA